MLAHCFAECSIEEICASLGIQPRDLFNAPSSPVLRTPYPYHDEDGKELYRKIRVEPGFNGAEKSFYSEHTDQEGRVIRKLKGCRRVLYRLPEVLDALSSGTTIFLVEGEKDADKLRQLGLIATTSPATSFWPEEFSKVLEGGNIVILHDMDKAGIERSELLCKSLRSTVKNLRVVELPGLHYQESHGADVSDWLATGHTINELLDIVPKTPLYAPPQAVKGKIRAVSLEEFLDMAIPEQKMLLRPFLPTQGLAMLYAKRGVGKTHIALGIARAVAEGGTFLKWSAPEPRKVLYIDGEMPANAMQERIRKIFFNSQLKPEMSKDFTLITPDLQAKAMPDLSTRAGRESIEEFVENSDLVIIDNLSSLFRSGLENEADSWQPAQDWALELRKQGKSVLFIHHAGKGGNQRGTSKREDILDTVINLKHPNNYCAEQGAQFEVHYEKTRHFAGEEAAPFYVQLCVDEKTGQWRWEVAHVQADPEVQKVAELAKKGFSINKIADEVKLTKSQVETRKKKAREIGLID